MSGFKTGDWVERAHFAGEPPVCGLVLGTRNGQNDVACVNEWTCWMERQPSWLLRPSTAPLPPWLQAVVDREVAALRQRPPCCSPDCSCCVSWSASTQEEIDLRLAAEAEVAALRERAEKAEAEVDRAVAQEKNSYLPREAEHSLLFKELVDPILEGINGQARDQHLPPDASASER